jgi:membrane protease YdiL (CAAX protease family)
MSVFVRKHSAVSLFLLALVFGLLPMAVVAAGLLPPGFTQLGALSASAAGIVLAFVESGRDGVRELLRRVLIWRVGVGWWLLVLFFPIVQAVGGAYLYMLVSGSPVDWSVLGPLYTVPPMMLFLIVFAGLGEEFGWRGFALPRLQARRSALAASLIVGVFHWLWHTPMFFIEGVGQNTMAQEHGFGPAFLGYGVLVVAISVQFSWIFNNTDGSVLLAAVFHGAANTWTGYLVGHMGSLGALLCLVAVNAAISIVIVLVYGARNLSRSSKRNTLDELQS